MSFWSWLGLPDRKEISTLQLQVNSLREENKALQEQNQNLFKYIEESDKKNRDIIIGEIQDNRKQIENSIYNINKYMELITEDMNNSLRDIVDLNKQITEYNKISNENYMSIYEACAEVSKVLKTESGDIREQAETIRTDILKKLQMNFELRNSEKEAILDKISKSEGEIKNILLKLQDEENRSIKYILDNNQLIKDNKNQIDKINFCTEDLNKKTDNIDSIQENLSSLAEAIKYLWTIMKAVWVDSVLSDMESLE